MTNRTVTAHDLTYDGVIGSATFVDGVATNVDDATDAGRRVINFAKRHGWAVSGGPAEVPETVAGGKPVSRWTLAECKAYLDDKQVRYPSGVSVGDARAAVQTAYETRGQGGSAAIATAGHTQGTFPVEGAPIVPGDDANKAADWSTPITGTPSDPGGEVDPTISVQPANVSVVHPATATFTVTGTGVPAPDIQWQKAEAGAPTVFADIDGATGASYTTPATSIAADNGDKYRAVLTNIAASITSAVATLTVT